MAFKRTLDTSFIVSFFKNSVKSCFCIVGKVKEVFQGSSLYGFLTSFVGLAKEENPDIWRNSGFVRRIVDAYNKLQKRISGYLTVSISSGYIDKIRKEFRLSPLRIGGIILISVVAINSALFFIFHRKLGAIGAAIRVVLLVAGFLGLLCNADWAAIKKSSVLLKILSR